MKTKYSLLIFVILLFVISVTMSAQIKRKIEQVAGKEVKTKIWQGREIQFVGREIAVKIIPSATQTEINKLLKTVGGKIINSFDKLGWGLIELPADKDEILAVDDLLKLPFVSAAEPNMVTRVNLEPNDPYFQGTSPATYPYQWALKNTGQTPPTGTNDADIDAPEAWNISTGNFDVIIAILDTGIPMLNGSLSHPDLDDLNKIILGSDYIDVPGTPEYQEGVRDRFGHGTHVAGIAAAESNNGTGIAGVAWNCKVLVVQVFDAYGSGTWPAFYNGVIYAVDYQRNNPSKKVVINFSGGGGSSQQALDAVIYTNTYSVPIVASAGNSSGGAVSYPAAYSSSYSNVIAISSTDATDTFPPFSSQGSQVCVSAPGGYGGYWDGYVYRYNGSSVLGKNIFSTTPNYTFNIAVDPVYAGDPYSTDVTQNYGYMPGTSMSAPHVTGVAGLLLSVNPNLTPSQIRNIIQQTAEDKGTPGKDNYYGYGRVNAYKALKYTLENYGGTLTQNLTIPSGETWNFQPGVTVTFAPGTSLIVNGTLNAIGNSSSRITFNRTGTSGQWGGIRFNAGSYGNIQYANISNASPGISVYSSNNIKIENSSFTDCFNSVFAMSGTAYIYKNTISGSAYSGIKALSNSNITLAKQTLGQGNNQIKDGRTGSYGGSALYADGNSYVLAGDDLFGDGGYNSITNYPSFVTSDNAWVEARYNWWGSYPPSSSGFLTFNGGTINYLPALSSPPTILAKQTASQQNTIPQSGINEKLSKALLLKAKGKFNDALLLFENLLAENSNNNLTSFIIVQIGDCINKLGNDLSSYAKNKKIDSKYLPLINELVADKRANGGDIKSALNMYEEILNTKPEAGVEKAVLFKVGNLYESFNNDKQTAEKYYDTLIKKYPGDELSKIIFLRRGILIDSGFDIANKENQVNDSEEIKLPTEFALYNNYPNPFNPTTKIKYDLPKESEVILKVYDILGREVTTLVSMKQEAGYHEVSFNAANLATGVYIYRISASGFVQSKKMLLVK